MRVLLQRVTQAQVTVGGEITGAIQHGFAALVGITHTDTEAEVDILARKTAVLRVFDDEAGKMNRSILDVGGSVLVVSQFTLYADAKGQRRPSYLMAARPEQAEPLVALFCRKLREQGILKIETGVFGAMMQVHIVNDGPVTIWLDSADHGRAAT
ncbi:MAG: D-tyrosyl-tRNA(Tyr) deacylase [Anaerolineae bacterium]|nr:MAG: D-tyrosyl-tRNA(Tyr) deacylase [Chloroflexi bacterium OLB13]MBC6956247.1 D-tyrosyl-tRNA(Tyr) deacylase [Chloroflexota bacterium]MBV6438021.1 D-aminoacyl-tRNA deacylase [Anaerolineae bacterium]MDL1915259.1 D-tyrosyl-tRNA(Tyr) deacylase [Anaerolineae bacterium CFX4]MBW7879717.1 D-tyrosyl-tRNA(Tyr) deacylase [Anaerolineae bacterium]